MCWLVKAIARLMGDGTLAWNNCGMMNSREKTEEQCEIPAPVPLCPQQISLDILILSSDKTYRIQLSNCHSQ
jgi:hypothetical protein